MSKQAVLVVLVLASGLGACSNGPRVAWAGPGWYLEKPYAVVWGGPGVYGGPMTYDDCEKNRTSRPNPEALLCVNETKKPVKYGFY